MMRIRLKDWIIIGLFAAMTTLAACGGKAKQENETETAFDPNAEFTSLSIFNLPSQWTSHKGEDMELKDLHGKVVAMVMIYTNCKATCPRLVADMRTIKERMPKDKLKDLQMVFVSIDPEADTPEKLAEFAVENKMNEEPWLFLRGTEEDTREFAAVLAVNYKRISPIDFSHSNIISVFNRKGELVHQREGIDVSSEETINELERLLASNE